MKVAGDFVGHKLYYGSELICDVFDASSKRALDILKFLQKAKKEARFAQEKICPHRIK